MMILFFNLIFSVNAAIDLLEKEKFTLKKSILFSLENSPAFDSIKRQREVSLLDEKSAQAKLFPSLDLITTNGLAHPIHPASNNPFPTQFNLSLTESLYDNGVTYTQNKIARLNRKQAEINFNNQKNKISLDIASQFLLYSLNVKLLQIQEKQFQLMKKQYQFMERGYHQGLKTKKDFFRFKTQMSRGELNLVAAKSTLEKSKQELQRLIGINLQSTLDIDFIPISLETVRNDIIDSSIKIENHLDYQAAQIQKEMNHLSADLIARKNLPQWFLSTSIYYTSNNYLRTDKSFIDNSGIGYNALLTVQYNFIDWGIRSRDKQVAFHKNMIQNNKLDENLLFLKSSLNQLKININQIQENIRLAATLLSLEKKNIEFIEQEYRTGKVQYLDLIIGLINFSDAESKFYSAVSDLQTSKYTLLYHEGKLYDEIIK